MQPRRSILPPPDDESPPPGEGDPEPGESQAPAVATSAASDAITVLRAAKRLVKTWCADGSIKGYDKAKNFNVEQRGVAGIRELSKLLTKLESDPHACIIRGRFVGLEAARKLEQLDHPGKAFRKNSLFDDQPLHAVLIEVDDFAPTADAVRDPEAAIREYIAACLPLEFQGASYHWQLSNSAGHADKQGVLKVHLWFWLKTPRTSAELKAWAGAIGLKADHSVFQKIQIHYTGAPFFEEGVADPVPLRSGFVDSLAADEVELDIDAAVLEAAKPEKATSAAKINQAQHNDPIARHLSEKGMVKSAGTDGRLNIVCPFEAEHTGDTGETSTTFFVAHTGGFERGGFKCQHLHCANRSRTDFLKAIGYSEGADDFEVLAKGTGDKPRGEVIGMADLLGKTFAPLHWVVPKVLPEGLFLLVSAPKIGKSWLALQLVLAVATGGEVLGQNVKAGDALYLALEDNERRLQDRLRQLGADTAVRAGRAEFATEWPLSNAGGTERIGEWLTAHPDARLVVVDVLERFRPRRSAKGNMYAEDYAAIAALKKLSDEHRVAVLVVHHTRKMKSDDPFAGVSGSQALTGGADGTLMLDRARSESRGKLHLTGRDIKEDGEFVVEFKGCRWAMLGPAREVAATFDRQEILNAMIAAGEPSTAAEVASATRRERTATSHLLKKMVHDGVVSKDGGKYWPAVWENLGNHGGGGDDLA